MSEVGRYVRKRMEHIMYMKHLLASMYMYIHIMNI